MNRPNKQRSQRQDLRIRVTQSLRLLALMVVVMFTAMACFGFWYANSYEAGVFNGGGHNRPTGEIGFGGPRPLGVLRLVHIEHSHGEVRTTVTFIAGVQVRRHNFHELDQRPPQEFVDIVGQWVIDQYNGFRLSQ